MWLELALFLGVLVSVPVAIVGLFVVRKARRACVLKPVATIALVLDGFILVMIPLMVIAAVFLKLDPESATANVLQITFWIATPLAALIVCVLDVLLLLASFEAGRSQQPAS